MMFNRMNLSSSTASSPFSTMLSQPLINKNLSKSSRIPFQPASNNTFIQSTRLILMSSYSILFFHFNLFNSVFKE